MRMPPTPSSRPSRMLDAERRRRSVQAAGAKPARSMRKRGLGGWAARLLGAARRTLLIGAGVCLTLAVGQADAQGVPDLVVEQTAVSDRTLGWGRPFTFRAAVVNVGDGNAHQTTLCYYRFDGGSLMPPTLPAPPTAPQPSILCPPAPMHSSLEGNDIVREIQWSAAFGREDQTSREDVALSAPAPDPKPDPPPPLPSHEDHDYYYYACVLPVRGETDTSNNCSAVALDQAVRVLVGDAPDLVVEGISVTNTVLGPGQSFNLRAGVVNRGVGDAPATVLRYYPRGGPGPSLDTDDVPALTAFGWPSPVPDPVDPSARSRQDTDLIAPPTAGTYTYWACVDQLDGESDPSNEGRDSSNCAAIDIEVAGGPDLAVQSAEVSETDLLLGEAFTFSATVVNLGDGQSAATTLRYFRSTNAVVSDEDVLVGTDRVEELVAGNTSPRSPNAASRQEIQLNAPPTSGTYYYYACVQEVTSELVTGNNCMATEDFVEVRVRGAPDLQVASPSVSSDVLGLGEAFTLSVTVFNAGEIASTATTLRYYRSADAIISSEDEEVGTDPVRPLNPGNTDPRNEFAESREEIDLNAPGSRGTYYYGACVVAVGAETDTDNNCSSAVSVDVIASPDLVVERPEVSDITLNTGQPFNLSVVVVNRGRGHSKPTTLRYSRSANASIDCRDEDIGTDPVREIRYSVAFEPDDLSSPEDIQLFAPRREGIYRYCACVDPSISEEPLMNEVNRDNNCSDAVRVLVGNDPNLAAEGPSVGYPNSENDERDEAILGPGQSFFFRVGVVNRGDGDSPATTLRYYRSRDDRITPGDTLVGATAAVPALRASFPPSRFPDQVHADSQTRLETELTAPAEAGFHYYGACITRVRREADTSDDCTEEGVRVEVRGTPDLEVNPVTVSDDRLPPGASFTLTATVVNFGRGGSAATTLRYYLSTDSTISSTDQQLGTDEVPQLDIIRATPRNPSAQSVQEIDLTAPEEVGAYYYGACVDPPPGESSTGDNCSRGVRVVVASGPDLVVEGLRVVGSSADDGKVFLGQSFRLRASVVNAGDTAFAESALRFYRSDDAEVTAADEPVGEPIAVTPNAALGREIVLQAVLPTGVQYYGACVAPVPNETDEGNNCAPTGVRVEVLLGPNLVVEAARVDDDSLAPGQTFIFQASVVNDGDSGSSRTTVRYYRSVDDRISLGDAPLGTDPVPSLNIVGRGVPWSASRSPQGLVLKAPTAEGRYYYGACVDSVSHESNANNNCSAAVRVTVSRNNRAGDPDLAAEASLSRSQVAPGGLFTLRVQVYNQGDEASENTWLRYYRSANAVVSGDADDQPLGVDLVEGIPKSDGERVSRRLHSRQVTAPNAAGAYYYGACVDRVEGESAVANNCADGVRITVGEDVDENADEDADEDGSENGGEEAGENMDGAAEMSPSRWRGWRSVLLRPPPVAAGGAS